MNQKGGLALLLIIVIVICLVIGVYYISAKTSIFSDAFNQISPYNSSTIKISTSSAIPAASISASPSVKPSPAASENPFSASATYENPFENQDYQNPFANL